MTCGEVREVLFAFLDNELDASLSIEVQRHMEHCPDCAREAETERTIQKRLADCLARDTDEVHALEDSLRAIPTNPAEVHRRRRFGAAAWARIGIEIAAVMLVGVFAHRYVSSTSIVHHPDTIVDLLVADFDHFVSEGRRVQLASVDRGEVSRWLQDNTGLAVTLPASKEIHCKLIGARKCQLNGKPAAFASYEMNAVPTCLVVLAGGPNTFAGMQRVSQDGRTFWVDRCTGHSVVACQRDDLIYAVVSRADSDELVHFLSELE